MTGRRPDLTLARRLTAGAFLVLLVLAARGWMPILTGSLTATEWLGVLPLLDPLATIESAVAGRVAIPAAIGGAAILLGVALVMGPVFCGWVCPLGLLLDLNASVRRRAERGWRRLRRRSGARSRGFPAWRLPGWIRPLALGLSVGLSFALALPVFQLVSPINLLTWGVVLGVGGTVTLIALGALLAAEWVAPRVWCRSLCPLGGLYTLVGARALLRIRIDPEEAGRPCRLCSRDCPMGIEVMEEHVLAGRSAVDDPDCTRCGTCVDGCPRGVLALSFRPRNGGMVASTRGASSARTSVGSSAPPCAPRPR